MKMSDITVPTSQTVSISFWMNHLIQNNRHVMLAGLSGTGKTQIANGLLSKSQPASSNG